MSETRDETIKRMRRELDALQQIETQEAIDEGARLHELHNAPWRKGAYSHLQFPPYVFKPFPKMLYGLDYPSAVAALEAAQLLPAFGQDDLERKQAILLAERRVQRSTTVVQDEADQRSRGANWFESPTAVVEYHAKLQQDVEVAAAHRAHEDRRMTGAAARERDAFDEQADSFVAEIPEQPKRAGKKVAVPA